MNAGIIPLYLNSILMNNLYTVGLTTFNSDIEVQRINTKTSSNTTYTMPISELTGDMTGRYVQGEVKFQIGTELLLEQYAIEITALIKLKKLLASKSMLKLMATPLDIRRIREKEYVEFEAIVHHNPHLKYIDRMIDFIEIDNLTTGIKSIDEFDGENKDELDILSKKINMKKELISDLRNKIKEYRDQRCEYLVTEGIYGTNMKAIIPVEDKHLLDNIEHLITCRVTVFGKVIKIGTKSEFGLYHRGMNYLEYIDKEIMSHLTNKEKSYLSNHIKREEEEEDRMMNDDEEVALILPISISM